jgi:hypothetical protein
VPDSNVSAAAALDAASLDISSLAFDKQGGLLPAVVPATTVRDQLRAWYRSRWWAPNKLKRAALTDTLHGIYLPYWTFDAHVDASWTAESGYY